MLSVDVCHRAQSTCLLSLYCPSFTVSDRLRIDAIVSALHVYIEDKCHTLTFFSSTLTDASRVALYVMFLFWPLWAVRVSAIVATM